MSKRSPRPILGLIVAGVVVVCVGIGSFRWVLLNSTSGVWSDMCGNIVYQEIPSPDGQYKVVVFERDCGATTDFSTQVSILGAAQELSNVSGNIFVMDGHPDSTNVQVEWEGDQAVSISYADGYEVKYRQRRFEDSSQVFEIHYGVASNE
jgi:hypothetical protein